MAEAVVGEELRKIKEALTIDIKALLYSSKDGLTERELKKEYRELTGQDIPFARIGYRSLYDLMKDLPRDVIIRRHQNGLTWIYYGIHDSKTKDLGKLVSGQLDRNKSVREQRRGNENRLNRRPHDYPSHETLSSNIQSNIESILKTAPNFKLKIKEFEKEYANRHGFMFNYSQYGYSNLREALESLKHMLKCENNKFSNNADYYVSLIVSRREIFINQNLNKILKPNNIPNESKQQQQQQQKQYQIEKNESNNHLNSTSIEYLTFEDELILNIVNLVESKGDEGIVLSSLLNFYKEHYKVPLYYEKLGYSSLDDFVFEKLDEKLQLKYPKIKYGELKLYSKNVKLDDDNQNDKLIIKEEKINPIDLETKLFEIKHNIEMAFMKNYSKKLSLDDFKRLFELKNGWKLDHREFGLKDFSALIAVLNDHKLIEIDYDQNNNPSICLVKGPDYNLNKSLDSTKMSDIFKVDETSFEEKRQYQAKFIQDFVFYNQDFDPMETIKQIANKEKLAIKISNVNSIEDIQIHIHENVKLLDKLMEDLEICYHGIGSSSYDMPIDYVQHGKICAAIYPGDNNWHRCRITGITPENNTARVEFIDYGGSASVGIRQLKFLDKKFAQLPIQAINARFSNVQRYDKRKDFLNYILKQTIEKVLEARIVGVNDGRLSLEIFDRSSQGILVNLNKRIIMDGYGIYYDETKDVEFYDFETWRKETFPEVEILPENAGSIKDFVTTTSNEESSTNETETEAVFKRRHKRIDNFFHPGRLKSLSEMNSNNSETQSENNIKQSSNQLDENQNDVNYEFLHVKHKLAKFRIFDTDEEIKLYLFKLNDQIYLHPFEVASLFGLKYESFKALLLTDKFNDKCFYKTYTNNEYTKNLFSLLRNDLLLDESFDEEEIMMISYKRILDLIDLALTGVNAQRAKAAISYRKQKAKMFYQETKQLYNDEDEDLRLNELLRLMNDLSNEAYILRRNAEKSVKDPDTFKNNVIEIYKNGKKYLDVHNNFIKEYGADIDFENLI